MFALEAKLHVVRCDDSVLNEKTRCENVVSKLARFFTSSDLSLLYLFQKYSLVDPSIFFFRDVMSGD